MDIKGRITVYSIDGCPHCKKAKAKLTSLNLPFHDISLSKHPEQRGVMMEITGKRTVPQVYFNEKHVLKLLKVTDSALEDLIAYVRDNPAPSNAPKLPKEGLPQTVSESFSEYSTVQTFDSVKNSGTTKLCLEEELCTLTKKFKEVKTSIGTHKYDTAEFGLFTSVHNSFSGKTIVEFIKEKKNFKSRDDALTFGQSLIKFTLIVSIDGSTQLKSDDTLYHFVEDSSTKALNAGTPYYGVIGEAAPYSSTLRTTILEIYAKFLSDEGNSVDYKGIAQSSEFQTYVALTFKLQRLSLENLTRNQLLAFFINVYNALVIHGNVKYGFPKNLLQRFKFFNATKYIIGGFTYSLQDIENGVLRGNRKGLGMMKKPFLATDPRIKYIVQPNEPLIHFALVCGAKSCPPIKTYSHEAIMDELHLATEAFLETDDGCIVDKTTNKIKLSKIFKWYKEDFGSTSEKVLDFVRTYMPESEKRNDLNDVINSGRCKLQYLHYDWQCK